MSKFKVGDEVRKKNGLSFEDNHFVRTIKKVLDGGYRYHVHGLAGTYTADYLMLSQPRKTTTPHKHAALIHAWADGAEIEIYRGDVTRWVMAYQPRWDSAYTYRIKPEKSEAELEREAIIKEMEALKVRLSKLEV